MDENEFPLDISWQESPNEADQEPLPSGGDIFDQALEEEKQEEQQAERELRRAREEVRQEISRTRNFDDERQILADEDRLYPRTEIIDPNDDEIPRIIRG